MDWERRGFAKGILPFKFFQGELGNKFRNGGTYKFWRTNMGELITPGGEKKFPPSPRRGEIICAFQTRRGDGCYTRGGFPPAW